MNDGNNLMLLTDSKIAVPISSRRKTTIALYANRLGVSVAALARMALNEYLDNHFPGWEEDERKRNP